MTEANMIKPRKWYQKKRYLIPGFLLGGIIIGNSFNSPETVKTQIYSTPASHIDTVAIPTYTPPAQTPIAPLVKEVVTPESTSNVPLSNDNHYINVDGERVHSPAYAPSVPAGASARCKDGTYSFSRNRRGTCSGHGGVAEWL